MEDSDEWDKAWLGALGTLPEMVGPGELPKLNEGLRYLFKELRQAQAAFTNESHLDGAYLSLVAVKAFLSLFRAASLEGLLVPLMELESALWALDEGITAPILKAGTPCQRWAAVSISSVAAIYWHDHVSGQTVGQNWLSASESLFGGSVRAEPNGHQNRSGGTH